MHKIIYVSTKADDSMKPLNSTDAEVKQNRAAFLQKHGLQPRDTTLVNLLYEGADYCRYKTVDTAHKGDGIAFKSTLVVDALVTTQPGHALLLPLADCIGAVLYDPTQHVLMLSHLGRHNLEQYGGTESVKYLMKYHGVEPKNLQVWLSPAAGKDNYPLHAFGGRGMHEVAHEQLKASGVLPQNITTSPIDTTKNEEYFSHSEYLKGNRPTDGRFCVVAVMQ